MWFPSHGVASKVIFFRKKGGWKRDPGFSAKSFFKLWNRWESRTLIRHPKYFQMKVFFFFRYVFPGPKKSSSGGVWMSKIQKVMVSLQLRSFIFLRFLSYKLPKFLVFPVASILSFFRNPIPFVQTTQLLLNCLTFNPRLPSNSHVFFLHMQFFLSFPTYQKLQVLYLFGFLNGHHDLAWGFFRMTDLPGMSFRGFTFPP